MTGSDLKRLGKSMSITRYGRQSSHIRQRISKGSREKRVNIVVAGNKQYHIRFDDIRKFEEKCDNGRVYLLLLLAGRVLY